MVEGENKGRKWLRKFKKHGFCPDHWNGKMGKHLEDSKKEGKGLSECQRSLVFLL